MNSGWRADDKRITRLPNWPQAQSPTWRVEKAVLMTARRIVTWLLRHIFYSVRATFLMTKPFSEKKVLGRKPVFQYFCINRTNEKTFQGERRTQLRTVFVERSSTKEHYYCQPPSPQIWKWLPDADVTHPPTHPYPHDACQTKLETIRKNMHWHIPHENSSISLH
jgi:hypothetical protein